MESEAVTMRRPAEVNWALIAIGVLLVASAAAALSFQMLEQKLGASPNAWRSLRIALNSAVSVAYLVGLSRGYGWVRWLFVISLAVTTLFLGFLVLVWMGAHGTAAQRGASFMVVVETPLLALRGLIVLLLFRPVSEQWFEAKAALRRAAAEAYAPRASR